MCMRTCVFELSEVFDLSELSEVLEVCEGRGVYLSVRCECEKER